MGFLILMVFLVSTVVAIYFFVNSKDMWGKSQYPKAAIAACIAGVSLLILIGMVNADSSSGSSSYEKNVKNGMHKLSNGQYDDMTDEEKEASEDFMEWQSEQNKKNK